MDLDNKNDEKDISYEFQILDSIFSDNKNKKKEKKIIEDIEKNEKKIKEKIRVGVDEELKGNIEIKEKEENKKTYDFDTKMNLLLDKLNTQINNVKKYVDLSHEFKLRIEDKNLDNQRYEISNNNDSIFGNNIKDKNMNNPKKNISIEKDKFVHRRFKSNDIKMNNFINNNRHNDMDNNMDEDINNNINDDLNENRYDDINNNDYYNMNNDFNISNNRIPNNNMNNNLYNSMNNYNYNRINYNNMNPRVNNNNFFNMMNNNMNDEENYNNNMNNNIFNSMVNNKFNKINNNNNINNMKKSWAFRTKKNNNINKNNDINVNINYNNMMNRPNNFISMNEDQFRLNRNMQQFHYMVNMYNNMNNYMNNNFMNYDYNYNNQNLNFNKRYQNKNIDKPQLNININFNEKKLNITINPESTIRDLIYEISLKLSEVDIRLCKIMFNSKDLNLMNKSLKLLEIGIEDKSTIIIVEKDKETGGYILQKQINIKFIKLSKFKKNLQINNNYELCGLLKLCLLKELSAKLDMIHINQLPLSISSIMEILKNGNIKSSNAKDTIKEILKKIEGSNIINFSRYVDKMIDSKSIKEMLLFLNEKDLNDINETKNILEKYNEHIILFEKELENAKKNSIFEFSVISLVIIEREDFETFQTERSKCPNRVNKILYHGTSIEPITNILTDVFKKSTERCYQHGKGVYFTDTIDYCWFYGSSKGNRENCNKIPKIKDNFTLIASSIYYDRKGFKRVYDYKYTPKKNEINFAYAGANFETIKLEKVDKSKFYGTEYVIYDLNQICSFIGATLERDEFCVIWRDPNFSKEPVYNNDLDEKYKKFLKERIIYIEQLARFNIYPFETSDEALKLIERKKYNKIILISNIGHDKSGKKFIEDARKILKSEVIALFLSYNESHLNWVQNFQNALFSNEPQFYESYLECFAKKHNFQIKLSLKGLKKSIENHYKIKLKFNKNFLDYPLFKDSGNYSDLTFN